MSELDPDDATALLQPLLDAGFTLEEIVAIGEDVMFAVTLAKAGLADAGPGRTDLGSLGAGRVQWNRRKSEAFFRYMHDRPS